MSSASSSRISSILLLLLGAGAFAGFRKCYADPYPAALIAQLMFLPLVLAVSFIRPIRQAIARTIERLRTPSAKGKLIGALVVATIAFFYLWRAAVLHDRDLSPRLQDEFSYLIQAQLLSHGKLWLPSPPLADFFETFHVIVKPVYASVYFPGTAMLYVPGVWLHLAHYWTALGLCAISVGLIYLLATELLDGAFGLLAALTLLTTRAFYIYSTLALSNIPAMIAGLLVYLAWLNWRKCTSNRARIGWAMVLGAVCGWGLIVRPLEMLAYIIPIAFLVEPLQLRRSIWVAFVAALPFLSIQLIFNKGVTGHYFSTPYRAYFDDFQPNTGLGFAKDDPAAHPKSDLKQKHDLYDNFLRPMLGWSRSEMFARWRIKFTTTATLPSDLLLLFIPLGAAAVLRDRRRIVCLVTPILFLGLYALYPYYMEYYALAIAPCVIVLALGGARALIDIARSPPARDGANVFVMCAIAAVCIAALPETRLDFGEELDAIPGLRNVNQELPLHAQPPAVVLFAYTDGASPHEEPVYNYDVANPLDAAIIRAQDLGDERNRQIIEFFATHRPATNFYRFDRGKRQLQSLGTAAHLFSELPAHPATAPAGVR
ncbi:hypothetical protein BH09PLA1_BH09PLA1_09840 [soil metagenome]